MDNTYKNILEKHADILNELEEAVIMRELQQIQTNTKKVVKSIDALIEHWCKVYSVQRVELEGGSRRHQLKMARFCIWWCIRNKVVPNELTYEAAGKLFNRNYATALHGVSQIDQWMVFETDLRNTIMKLLADYGFRSSWNEAEKKLHWMPKEELYTE